MIELGTCATAAACSFAAASNAPARAKTRPGVLRKATCGVTGTGDAGEAYGAAIFVRGEMDGWADPPVGAQQFQNLGGNDYQAEFELSAGTYAYKIATGDWSKKGRSTGFPEEEWISALSNTLRVDDHLAAQEAVLEEHDPEGLSFVLLFCTLLFVN